MRKKVKMKGDANRSERERVNPCLPKKLEEEFYKLQKYGTKKAKEQEISNEDIERLIFEDR